MWIFFCTFAAAYDSGKQVQDLYRPAAVSLAFGNKIGQIALCAIKATCAFALPKTNLAIAFGDPEKEHHCCIVPLRKREGATMRDKSEYLAYVDIDSSWIR